MDANPKSELSKQSNDQLCKRLVEAPNERETALIVPILESRLDMGDDSLAVHHLMTLLPRSKDRQEKILQVIVDQKKAELGNSQIFHLMPYVEGSRLHGLVQILISRAAQLTGAQLCSLLEKAPQFSTQIVDILFHRRDQLQQLELIYLAKAAAIAAPPEYHKVLQMIFLNEKNRQPTKDKLFTLCIPEGVLCNPQKPVLYSSDPSTKIAPLHFFSTLTKDKFYIDIYGDFHRLALSSATGLQVDISLAKYMKNTKVAAVFLSLPPSYSTGVNIGYLSAQNPTLKLRYPFPIVEAAQVVRIGIVLQLREAFAAMAQAKQGEVVAQDPAAAVKPTGVTDSSVVVCFGEIHQFNVQTDETMGDLMKRSCKRWNLNHVDYEIQDLNFQTYADNKKFSEAFGNGSSRVVRLVKKSTIVPPVLQQGWPGQQQQQGPPQFVFAPPSPNKNVWPHKN